jgi:hypothetical protein
MKTIDCPLCNKPLVISLAHGRKSHKPFLMLKCQADGRHFRGFITDQNYLNKVMAKYDQPISETANTLDPSPKIRDQGLGGG